MRRASLTVESGCCKDCCNETGRLPIVLPPWIVKYPSSAHRSCRNQEETSDPDMRLVLSASTLLSNRPKKFLILLCPGFWVDALHVDHNI